MKYCPDLSCPHRARVRVAAEFVDTVAVCSDCSAELVAERDLASAETALATRGVAGNLSVYRQARRGGLPRRGSAEDLARTRRIGRASLVGGIGLVAIGCALVSLTGGAQNILLLGPIAFVAFRLGRDVLDGPPEMKKAAKKP